MTELNGLTPLAAGSLLSAGVAAVRRLADGANLFKTPSLWGAKHTAPYFHDNSARDLDGVFEQYGFYFLNLRRRGLPATPLTLEHEADIKAHLALLD